MRDIGLAREKKRIARWTREQRFDLHLRRVQRRHDSSTREGRRAVFRWMLKVAAYLEDDVDRDWWADRLLFASLKWPHEDLQRLLGYRPDVIH